jgi:hypothetical protein
MNEGETIVTSGQFLIDSESNLREAINKMLEAGQSSLSDTKKTHHPSIEHDQHEIKMEEDMNMDEMKQESSHEHHEMGEEKNIN